MSDLFEWQQQETKQRFKTSRTIILIGWVFLLIIGIVVIGANVYMGIHGLELNETLSNWGGIVLGFLFGSFPTIMREFISDKTDEKM